MHTYTPPRTDLYLFVCMWSPFTLFCEHHIPYDGCYSRLPRKALSMVSHCAHGRNLVPEEWRQPEKPAVIVPLL
jgi:hypothetical protein